MASKDKAGGPGVGFEYPRRPATWLKRDALLFAQSIGGTADELHFLYENHPRFSVFPTYLTILPHKLTDQEVVDFHARQGVVTIPGVPKFDSRKVLDGERAMRFYRSMPTSSVGYNFEVRQRVNGVYDKGKAGSVVETEYSLVDRRTDQIYATLTSSSFYVGQGGWGGPRGPSTTSYPPPSDRSPDIVYKQPTSSETALLYRLNGDYNPLHADPEVGKARGFGGPIIHGLYSFNSSAHAVLKSLGRSDPANFKSFQARFTSPVTPGDVLYTEMWALGKFDSEGFEEVRFQAKTQKGKVVMNNGVAFVRAQKVATKL